jgi:hypothetical protein
MLGEKIKLNALPALVAEILGISRDGAQLLSIAAEHLRIEGILSATAVSQALHHRINLLLKHLR